MTQPISKTAHAGCHTCTARTHCLFSGVEDERVEEFEAARGQLKIMRADDVLFEIGEPIHDLYVVRSGTVKTSFVTEEGVEHVIGFYLPGDVIGLDAIAEGHYTSDAVVLETSSICKYSLDSLMALAQQSPGLQKCLWQQASKEIRERQKLAIMIGHASAAERVATFLLGLAARLHATGLSASDLRLPMSRMDMAVYLGLSVETVCRTLTRLQAAGLLTRDQRNIVLRDVDALAQLSQGEGDFVPQRCNGRPASLAPAHDFAIAAG